MNWIVSIVIFAVMATIAIAGIMYGLATDDEAVFADNAQFDRDMIPLQVGCAGYDEEAVEGCSVVSQVVSAINSRVGFLTRFPSRNGVRSA